MTSVIIVGAGVIGMMTAIELQRAGAQVTLLDRQDAGRESSWAGGGIISPLFPWRYPDAVTRLALLSQQIYPRLIDELRRDAGLDPEFLQSGMLILGDYEEERPADWARRFAIDMQAVDAAEIHRLAPELAADFDRGWWFPQVYQARNPRLLALLRAWIERSDIDLVEQAPVGEILVENGRARGVMAARRRFEADTVVVASGAWSARLLDPLGCPTGIEPVRGQMLLLKARPGQLQRIILSQERYIIPRRDGRILIGSTTEHVGFDKSTRDDVRQSLHRYALRSIPALADAKIEQHWSGLRPGIPDGIPAIGEHPEVRNLFIHAGHYRNGLVMAPASARLLTDLLLNRTACPAPADYAICDAAHKKN
jgi:glycine oxidase